MTPFIEMVRALGLVLLGVGRFVLGGLVTMGLSWVISFFVRKAYRRQQGDFKHVLSLSLSLYFSMEKPLFLFLSLSLSFSFALVLSLSLSLCSSFFEGFFGFAVDLLLR